MAQKKVSKPKWLISHLLAIEEADIVLFLVDARVGMTVADQAIANHLRKQEKKVLCCCQ